MDQNSLDFHLHEMIANRLEKLLPTLEALPAYRKGEKEIGAIRAELEKVIDREVIENLISQTRGNDVILYEHCYLTGLLDGLHLVSTLEEMNKR